MDGSRDIEGMFVFTLNSGVVMGYPKVDAIDAFKMAYPDLWEARAIWQNEVLIFPMTDNL